MTKDELEDSRGFSPDTDFSVIEIKKARDAINPPRKPSQTPGSETALTTKERERAPYDQFESIVSAPSLRVYALRWRLVSRFARILCRGYQGLHPTHSFSISSLYDADEQKSLQMSNNADFFESSKNCKIVIVFLRFKSRRGKTVEVELICVILLCSLGIA